MLGTGHMNKYAQGHIKFVCFSAVLHYSAFLIIYRQAKYLKVLSYLGYFVEENLILRSLPEA